MSAGDVCDWCGEPATRSAIKRGYADANPWSGAIRVYACDRHARTLELSIESKSKSSSSSAGPVSEWSRHDVERDRMERESEDDMRRLEDSGRHW